MKLMFKFIRDKIQSEKNYFNRVKKLTGLSFQEYLKLKYDLKTSKTHLYHSKLSITDNFWHLHSLNEVFIEGTYEFTAFSSAPTIIDCGANVGLSSIFFKKLYPEAKILAYEADTEIYKMMLLNFKTFGLNDIVSENKAVWIEDSFLEFNASGALGGSVSSLNKNTSKANTITIPSIRLRNLLQEIPHIDFLKMDIEGAEIQVLNDCKSHFNNVNNIFVEFHRLNKANDSLGSIISIIEDAGFKVYIKEAWNNLPKPFLNYNYNPHFDLQVNIFGYRVIH